MKCPFDLHGNGNGRKINLSNFKEQKAIEKMGQKNGDPFHYYKGTEYSVKYHGGIDDAFYNIYISEYEESDGNFYILSICGVETFCIDKDELDSAVQEYFWWTNCEEEAEELGLLE